MPAVSPTSWDTTLMTDDASCAPVLLVEDDEVLRTIFARALAFFGLNPVWVASSGEEARDLILRSRPKLIVADCNLPSTSRLDLVRWLRGQDTIRAANVPIVLMSGSISPKEQLEALHAGADSVLEKPFRLADLEKEIRRHLNL